MIDTPTQIPSPHLRAAAASPPLRAKGWTYEFVEQKDAGTGTGDLIFILYRKPNWILRACGAGDERVSYYRSHGEWYNIGGSRVGNQVGSMLQHLGSKYLPDDPDSSCVPEFTADDDADRIDRVQLASEESFPASDAPAWTSAKV